VINPPSTDFGHTPIISEGAMGQLPHKRGLEREAQEALTLVPTTIIRTETTFSKLPIHNLSKRGRIDISIIRKNEHDEIKLRWEVSYNQRYGQPRQIAYRLDTIIINRRIDEYGRPLPKVIRFGSLNQLCRELDLPVPPHSTVVTWPGA
jgi:hypothetical protein